MKYKSSITYHSKAMADVKVFAGTDGQTDRPKTICPRSINERGIKLLKINSIYLCNILFYTHVSNFFLNGSEGVNLLFKLGPVCCMINSFLDTVRLGTRQRSSHTKSAIVQNVHGHFETSTHTYNIKRLTN